MPISTIILRFFLILKILLKFELGACGGSKTADFVVDGGFFWRLLDHGLIDHFGEGSEQAAPVFCHTNRVFCRYVQKQILKATYPGLHVKLNLGPSVLSSGGFCTVGALFQHER